MKLAVSLYAVVALFLLIGRTDSAEGYTFEVNPSNETPLSWPSGNVTMNLQLSTTTVAYPDGQAAPLDGSASWNAVAQAALAEWNQYLSSVQFVSNTNVGTPAQLDGVNSVFFSSTAYGQGFGSDAIAVTLLLFHTSTSKIAEADVVVNTAYEWDSYRGNLKYDYTANADRYDLRRVLDHEFGHVLGLNHPDLASPPQNVVAIMNSTISDLDHIEQDDIDGVMSLYGPRTVLASVTATVTSPGGGMVAGAGNFQIGSVQQLTAMPAAGYVFVQWEDGTTNAARSIVVPVQGGTYTATFGLALAQVTGRFNFEGGNNQLGALILARNQFYVFGADPVYQPTFSANSVTVTSPDGTTWTQAASNSTIIYAGTVAYGNGIFVHLDGTNVYTSTDAITWTPALANFSNSGLITYGNGIFVTTGPYAANTPTPILSSPDGIHWTSSPSGVTAATFSSMTYGKGRFVMVGVTYTADAYFTLVSTDGTNWTVGTQIANVVTENYQGQLPDGLLGYGNGRFIVIMRLGSNIMTSTDGLTWVSSTYPGAGTYRGELTGIAYGNGIYLATSDYGTVTSLDGTNWNGLAVTSPLTSNLGFGANTFVGLGYSSISQTAAAPELVAASVLPVISSGASVQVSPGAALHYQIAATNTPIAFNALGLPTGLSVNTQTGVISGILTGTGSYPVTLLATNDAGSGTATLTVTAVTGPMAQTFTAWALANGVTGAVTDTPKGDSVPNGLKYFYDINPQTTMSATDRAALPVLTTPSGTMLTLTYRENKAVPTFVDVSVESSTDLQTWGTPTGATITATGLIDQATGDPMMQAQVPITHPGKQFIRLVVTPQ